MKCIICMSVQLNILSFLCLISINRQFEFDNDAWVLFNFHSKIQWNKDDLYHMWLIQTKFNMTTLWLDNHPRPFGSWSVARFSVSWLSWARSRSELASADPCLKRFDATPSATTLTILNNPRDLDLDCSAASFLVQWTQAHWNAGKLWRVACMALRPVWTRSRCSRSGELPAVNLVRVHSHSKKHYFSTCLHRHKVRLTKSWNSDTNHRPNALREMFTPLQHSLDIHSLFNLTCWVSSGLTTCVRDRPCFTVFRIKIVQNSCLIVKFNAILGVLTIYAN